MLLEDVEVFGRIVSSKEARTEVAGIKPRARRARAEVARQAVRRYLRELYITLREERREGR